MSKIAVIGAGVTGVTTAYRLLQRGHDVTVIDRHDGAAMETSFANGGQVSVSNAEVWNNWPTVVTGLQSLLRANAPLHVHPCPSWHKISWFTEFLLEIRNHRQNTLELATLALRAREALRQIAEDEEIAFDMNDCGLLHVYKTPREFELASRSNIILNKAGLERHAVTLDEIQTIEPALQGTFIGGYFTPGDFAGDIHKFTKGLLARCIERGVKTLFNTAVTTLNANADGVFIETADATGNDARHTDTTAYDKIVICAGVASRTLAKQVGDRINVYPVKGYSITVELDTDARRKAAPQVCLLDEQAKIVTSRLGKDRLRIAGIAEFTDGNTVIRPDRIATLTAWCDTHFADVAAKRATPWAGNRPMLPRMIPYVGRGRLPSVYYNTGHGHLGWTLSAGTSETIANLIG